MEGNVQKGLLWAKPQEADTAPAHVPMPSEARKLMIRTQAPVYAALLVGGIVIGTLLGAVWAAYHPNELSALRVSK